MAEYKRGGIFDINSVQMKSEDACSAKCGRSGLLYCPACWEAFCVQCAENHVKEAEANKDQKHLMTTLADYVVMVLNVKNAEAKELVDKLGTVFTEQSCLQYFCANLQAAKDERKHPLAKKESDALNADLSLLAKQATAREDYARQIKAFITSFMDLSHSSGPKIPVLKKLIGLKKPTLDAQMTPLTELTRFYKDQATALSSPPSGDLGQEVKVEEGHTKLLQNMASALTQELKDLDAAKTKAGEELADTKAKITAKEVELAKLETKKNVTLSEIAQLDTDKKAQAEALSVLQSTIANLSERDSDKQSQLETLNKDITERRQALEKLKMEAADANAELQGVYDKLRELASQGNVQLTERANVRERLAVERWELEGHNKTIEEQQKLRQSLQATIQTEQANIEKLQSVAATHRQVVAELEKQERRLKESAAQLRSEQGELQPMIAIFTAAKLESRELASSIESQKKTCASLKKQAEELKNSLAALQDKKNKIEGDLSAEKKALDQATKTVADIKERTGALRKEHDETAPLLEQAGRDLKQGQDHIQRANTNLATLEQQKQELLQATETITREVETLRTNKASGEKELMQLCEQKDAQKKSMRACLERAKSLQTQIPPIREHVKNVQAFISEKTLRAKTLIQTRISEWPDMLKTLNKDTQLYQTEYQKAMTEREYWKSKSQFIKEEVKTLDDAKKAIKGEKKHLELEVASLRRQKEYLESNNAGLHAELTQAEANVEQLRALSRKLTTELGTKRNILTSITSEMDLAAGAIKNLSEQLNKISGMSREYIGKLHKFIEKAQSSHAKLKQHYNATDNIQSCLHVSEVTIQHHIEGPKEEKKATLLEKMHARSLDLITKSVSVSSSDDPLKADSPSQTEPAPPETKKREGPATEESKKVDVGEKMGELPQEHHALTEQAADRAKNRLTDRTTRFGVESPKAQHTQTEPDRNLDSDTQTVQEYSVYQGSLVVVNLPAPFRKLEIARPQNMEISIPGRHEEVRLRSASQVEIVKAQYAEMVKFTTSALEQVKAQLQQAGNMSTSLATIATNMQSFGKIVTALRIQLAQQLALRQEQQKALEQKQQQLDAALKQTTKEMTPEQKEVGKTEPAVDNGRQLLGNASESNTKAETDSKALETQSAATKEEERKKMVATMQSYSAAMSQRMERESALLQELLQRTTTIKMMAEQVQSGKQQAVSMREALAKLTIEREQFRQDKQAWLTARDNKVREAKTALTKIKEQYSSALTQQTAPSDKIVGLNTRLQTALENLQAISRRWTRLRDQVKEQQNTFQEQHSQGLEEATKQLSDKDTLIAQLQREITDMKQNAENANRNHADIQTDIEETKKQLAAAKAEQQRLNNERKMVIATLQSFSATLLGRIQNESTSVNLALEKMAAIKAMTENVQTITQKLVGTRDKLIQVQKEKEQLQGKAGEWQAESTRQSQELATLHDGVAKLNITIDVSNNEKVARTKELEELKAHNTSLTQKIEKLQQEKTKVRNSISLAKQEYHNKLQETLSNTIQPLLEKLAAGVDRVIGSIQKHLRSVPAVKYPPPPPDIAQKELGQHHEAEKVKRVIQDPIPSIPHPTSSKGDEKCYKNHELVWSVPTASTRSEFTCLKCNKKKSNSSGMWSCPEKCVYAICRECRPLISESSLRAFMMCSAKHIFALEPPDTSNPFEYPSCFFCKQPRDKQQEYYFCITDKHCICASCSAFFSARIKADVPRRSKLMCEKNHPLTAIAASTSTSTRVFKCAICLQNAKEQELHWGCEVDQYYVCSTCRSNTRTYALLLQYLQCPQPRTLKLIQNKGTMDFACNLCQQVREGESSLFCEQCNYRICDICAPLQIRDKTGHTLVWSTSSVGYPDHEYTCALCPKTKYCSYGRWSCSICCYDICEVCRPPLGSIMVSNRSLRDTKNHALSWTTKTIDNIYSTYVCSNCEGDTSKCSSGRYACLLCKYDLCPGCQLPQNAYLYCTAGHPLTWSIDNIQQYKCKGCENDVSESYGMWCCSKGCNYAICAECRPPSSLAVMKAYCKCFNGDNLKWDIPQSDHIVEQYTCKLCGLSNEYKLGRWYCRTHDYSVCPACRSCPTPETVAGKLDDKASQPMPEIENKKDLLTGNIKQGEKPSPSENSERAPASNTDSIPAPFPGPTNSVCVYRGLNKICPGDHVLHLTTNQMNLKGDKYACSQCNREYPWSELRWHCRVCEHAFCTSCHPLPTKEVSILLPFVQCMLGHTLNIIMPSITSCTCALCRATIENSIMHWGCETCTYHICPTCRPLPELGLMDEKNHALYWSTQSTGRTDTNCAFTGRWSDADIG